MNLEELMASTPPMQQHALIKGFQAGAASRDAEVVSLTNQRDYEYVRAENAEHDRLLVEIAAKDAEIARLKTVPMRYRRMAFNAQLQDEVARLEQENDQLRVQVKMLRDALEVTHELYANTSSGYGFARPENPHNFHCDIDCCSKEEIEAHSKACDDYAAGRKVSNDSWGIGTYCDEYAPAIKALAATEQTK